MSAVLQATEVQSTPTEQQSITMIKNIVRSAVSTIAYIRNLFPETCFDDRALSGLNIKTLNSSCRESHLLCKWLEDGVFDALKHKYLRSIIFGVFLDKNSPNSLLECYNFNVTYPNNSIQISQNSASVVSSTSKDDIRKSTVSMIRTLISMASTLKPIPDDRFITMKLLYYDDITPDDYEPPFFRSMKDDMYFESKPLKIKIGSVNTPYHSMDLKIQTIIDSFDESASQVENSNKERIKTLKWNVEMDSDEESSIDPVWTRVVEYVSGQDYVTGASLVRKLNVSKTESKSLLSRLIQEGYIEEEAINLRKGRKVIKKNNENQLCNLIDKVRVEEEADVSSDETEDERPTRSKRATGNPRSIPDEIPSKLKRKLSTFEFSTSQDNVQARKVSIVKDPIYYKKRKEE